MNNETIARLFTKLRHETYNGEIKWKPQSSAGLTTYQAVVHGNVVTIWIQHETTYSMTLRGKGKISDDQDLIQDLVAAINGTPKIKQKPVLRWMKHYLGENLESDQKPNPVLTPNIQKTGYAEVFKKAFRYIIAKIG
jgi:hypothetical protein